MLLGLTKMYDQHAAPLDLMIMLVLTTNTVKCRFKKWIKKIYAYITQLLSLDGTIP